MKSFSHKRPVRDDKGEVAELRPAPVWRRTESDSLGYHHGSDRGRKLAVGLLDGDIIAIRPAGTRRDPLTILASDLYDELVRRVAYKAKREKDKIKKDKKAARLARLRQERAEKRLVRPMDDDDHCLPGGAQGARR